MVRLERFAQRIALAAQMMVDFNSADLGLNRAYLTSFQDEVYFTSLVLAENFWVQQDA